MLLNKPAQLHDLEPVRGPAHQHTQLMQECGFLHTLHGLGLQHPASHQHEQWQIILF
jgi:hypothetical protein